MSPELQRALADQFVISSGGHPSFEQGACVMEAVAWVAGEPHSGLDRMLRVTPEMTEADLAALAVSPDALRADVEARLAVESLGRTGAREG